MRLGSSKRRSPPFQRASSACLRSRQITVVPSKRGYSREAAIRPNSVTPQRTRNDRIRRFRQGQAKCGRPDHDQLTDLVLEMAAERLSLEADAVLLGQKCPLFCRNEPVTPVGPVNSMRKLPIATKKGKLMAHSRAYWVLSQLPLCYPFSPWSVRSWVWRGPTIIGTKTYGKLRQRRMGRSFWITIQSKRSY